MNFSVKTKNSTIYRNSPIPKEYEELCEDSINKIKGVYKRNLKRKFKVYICDNDKEYKTHAKYFYSKGAAGTVLRDSTMVIKSKEFLYNNEKAFKQVFLHEMAHVYWEQFYRSTKPQWLNEGLASAIAKEYWTEIKKEDIPKLVEKFKITKDELHYRYMEKQYKTSPEHIRTRYGLWKGILRWITKNNLNRIIRFMDEYTKNPTRKNYEKLFKKEFGRTPEEAFKEFTTQAV